VTGFFVSRLGVVGASVDIEIQKLLMKVFIIAEHRPPRTTFKVGTNGVDTNSRVSFYKFAHFVLFTIPQKVFICTDFGRQLFRPVFPMCTLFKLPGISSKAKVEVAPVFLIPRIDIIVVLHYEEIRHK